MPPSQPLRAAVAALGIAIASPASAATVHGLVYDDLNGDGKPSAGEPGIAGAVVAFGAEVFTTTDGSGQFSLIVPTHKSGIVWVRVPDGFVPRPVWGRYDIKKPTDIDLGLRKRPASPGPITFVVAADTHIAFSQDYVTATDLATAATQAVALEPPPAFFTILGDITQGNRAKEFALVDAAVGSLGVPFIPVAGNHDWYDGGAAWFAHYGPDNYSFDLGGAHFVVWNMAMSEPDIRTYLGAELARVAKAMPVIALTHAPPSDGVVDALRELGVDYVLTGHAHSNRVVDHTNLIELNTEPFVMGGLDFTPGGYRVMTLDNGRLITYHRTTVDLPQLSIITPSRGSCAQDKMLVVAAELDAGDSTVTARIDCGTPLTLRRAGGWNWHAELPPLAPGAHSITVEGIGPTGTRATTSTSFEVCKTASPPPPPPGPDWPELGGKPSHVGAAPHEIAPPLGLRWTAVAGGHVITAPPVIAGGTVFVPVSDLGDGDAGGVVAFDLVTGAQRWRAPTPKPVRGGIAVTDGVVVVSQIDSVVLGLDAATGVQRWQHELSVGLSPQAYASFAPPTIDHDGVLVGQQRALSALSPSGATLWTDVPVPDGVDSQSAAAIALGDTLAVGTFNRALGGIIAWDRSTRRRKWSVIDDGTVAVNASPVIAADSVFVVSGADHVTAFDFAGQIRWRTKLDPEGFDWGNATIGTPAYADNVLVVPTLYRDLVALDAASGVELWRHAGLPGPLYATHYRGAREAGFSASPVITGGIVWAADTAGQLSALELRSGRVLWRTQLGTPVLAGLAVSGDWLIVAAYDGSVRAFTHVDRERAPRVKASCDVPPAPSAGCCDATGSSWGACALVGVLAVLWRRRRPVRCRA